MTACANLGLSPPVLVSADEELPETEPDDRYDNDLGEEEEIDAIPKGRGGRGAAKSGLNAFGLHFRLLSCLVLSCLRLRLLLGFPFWGVWLYFVGRTGGFW